MDDSEHVCPLCCEELDLSDREFYPCKCGYQVCMWCWHRIRETESGLCPACRTPYGEDPHQFSAVDVDKVLKANKEKEAAAKRDRQQRNSIHNPSPIGSGGGVAGLGASDSHHHATTDGGGESLHQFGEPGAMDAPKDRALLANMRVIRRDLVYAVGLPPNIGTEDQLRKPEFFGQYGRIAKIVVNRTQATSGDPRRATASAYVTFAHKEDTLACILAMDGYHMDGRNVRASYGTSKYCSAFIKSVRCNNPDCTYLHEMGAAEDTFSKQEIQAGYVTSGRDVLARQQQIVAEQLRLAGSSGGIPRKRVGGGGPSGTGKASNHPVFPAPEFDEPSKPNPTLVPAPSGVTRASTSGPTPAMVAARPASRAASLSAKSSGGLGSTAATPASATAASLAPQQAAAAVHHPPPRKPQVSAASVVAGVHSVSSRSEPAEPHTTLTPLTPLKRASKAPARAASTGDVPEHKLTPVRSSVAAKKKNGVSGGGSQLGSAASAPTAAVAQPAVPASQLPEVPPSVEAAHPGNAIAANGAKPTAPIGGDPIGPPTPVRNSGGVSSLVDPVGPELGAGNSRVGGTVAAASSSSGPSSLLGGDVFTGQLPAKSHSAIGRGGKDKWNANEDAPVVPAAHQANASLWGGVNADSSNGQPLPPPGHPGGGGIIGSSRAPGPPSGPTGNSSSALASILGINLPTGTGSLQESTSLWAPSPSPMPAAPSPLSSLNSSSVPVQGNVIGGAPVGMGVNNGSSLIGGVPIGGGSNSSSFDSSGAPGTIGGQGANTKSDIALLQSLLPGVHITSGSDSAGFGTIGGGGNWNTAPPNGSPPGPGGLGGDTIVGNSGSWGGVPTDQHPRGAPGGAAIGTIGGSMHPQQQQRGTGLW